MFESVLPQVSRRDLLRHIGLSVAAAAIVPRVFAAASPNAPAKPWRLTAAGDALADGYLRQRLDLSYRRLQEPYFQWAHISTVNIDEFPGDALGRAINGLSFLGQSLRTAPAANLKEIMQRIPTLRNPEGYLGRILPADRADEDSVAGHNGLLCGLVEYYRWTQDPAVLSWLRDIRDSLFVPLHKSIAYYRQDSEERVPVQWRLSTFDIGQLFLTLDGLTRAYEVVPSPAFKAMIDAMIDRYRSLDVVRISAQTHSMLSATRGLVRWYRLHGRPADLALAEKRFDQYRRLAMTETYENYNWFNRPTHTEGCALVDSFELATDLWSVTENPGYLEIAHLIFFNALMPGQCLNGGFGVGTCVGASDPNGNVILTTSTHSEAAYCCSMRGAEGLVYAARASHFVRDDSVALPFFNSVRATVRFHDGVCEISQSSGYPHDGSLKMELLSSSVKADKRLRFFVPPWVERDSVTVRVDGQSRRVSFDGAFAQVPVRLASGTRIELAFRQLETPVGLEESARSPGFQRFRRGPLLLGLAAADGPQRMAAADSVQGVYAVGLRPLFDVLDPLSGREASAQVLFAIPGADVALTHAQAPPADPMQSSLASDIAPSALASYRKSPQAPRARGLFVALEAEGTVLDAFVWSEPQTVTQIVLEWAPGAEMPDPSEVVVRWLPAGAVAATHRSAADVNRGLREKKTPGVIGDGTRWVFTLTRELGAGAIDNAAIVVLNRSVKRTPPQRIRVLTR